MKIFDRMQSEGVSRVCVTQDNLDTVLADEDASLRDLIRTKGHEEVHFCQDAGVDLRCIIGVHNTNRGPALGGCRMNPYSRAEDSEAAGLIDVLRLSEGMSYKCALAELPLGGGKAVIVGDAKTQKSEGLLKRFASFVGELDGKYITAEDSGTTINDINLFATVTDFVTGTGSEGTGSGDPSPRTAFGVYRGLLASLDELGRKPKNLVIAMQGLGNVGYHLLFGFPKGKAKFDPYREEFDGLDEIADKIFVTDIDPEKVDRVLAEGGGQIEFINPDEIYDVDAEVFSPNAMGGILNGDTIPRLKCKLVAGAANNQLKDPAAGRDLHERGILYAPDYAINAGGAINIVFEMDAERTGGVYDNDAAIARVRNVYDTMKACYQVAREKDIPTFEAADVLARERFMQPL
jgi:leucine dehydrogenase